MPNRPMKHMKHGGSMKTMKQVGSHLPQPKAPKPQPKKKGY